mgnify:CR=1 FL=1
MSVVPSLTVIGGASLDLLHFRGRTARSAGGATSMRERGLMAEVYEQPVSRPPGLPVSAATW